MHSNKDLAQAKDKLIIYFLKTQKKKKKEKGGSKKIKGKQLCGD